ncbi:TLC ATP/ADP transporter-domain-containing protein [Haematococcus lacustris]
MAFLYAYNSSTAARAALPLCPAAQIQFSSSGSMWHTVPTRLAAPCRVTPMLGAVGRSLQAPAFCRGPRALCSLPSQPLAQPQPPEPASTTHATKVAALGLMFFSSTFIYTILQNLKDSIVVTTVGAEALPFLEAFVVLPISLLFFMLYNKLNKAVPDGWVYQAALSPLLLFYTLFATVLYPCAAQLHPTHMLDSLRTALPDGFAGLAGMLVHWSYSLFFASGELWGGVAISLLFWGLADEVCTMGEAKHVFPLLGFVANIGLVVAGAFIKAVNAKLAAQDHVLAVQVLLGTVVAVAGLLLGLKTYVYNNHMIHDPAELAAKEAARAAKAAAKASGRGGQTSEAKGGLMQSLGVLRRSPKVGNLAVLVISYFLAQKLFDFAWKAQLRVFYPSAAAYQTALADVAQYTGIATMVGMACSKYVFHFGGWITAALATPITMGISGATFFASAIAMQGGASMLGPHAVSMLVAVGAVAGVVGRVASRAPKYSLFDPAKEMVYISMSKTDKNEGKATVDLLGSYFGKSGASWITQVLVLGLGSLSHALPIIGLVHLSVSLLWIRSTFSLAAMMKDADPRGRPDLTPVPQQAQQLGGNGTSNGMSQPASPNSTNGNGAGLQTGSNGSSSHVSNGSEGHSGLVQGSNGDGNGNGGSSQIGSSSAGRQAPASGAQADAPQTLLSSTG